MPAAHHQYIPIDRNVVPDGPRGHVSTMLLLLLLLIMTFPYEVRCRRSQWIVGWLHLPVRSTHWLLELMYDIFSDTFTVNAEIIMKTASFAVLMDPPPNWVSCGDAGLAGRCFATCSIASPSLGQCTGIQDRLGTAPGAGHLATPQRTAFERCICFQNHFIKQKRATLHTATS